MNLRVTKGRIALVALLLVLYVLNIGPMVFYCKRFGLDQRVLVVYIPLVLLVEDTPCDRVLQRYLEWWDQAARNTL